MTQKPKKKRKLDPNIIRVGDWVEIINPIFVTRCGYPLSFEDARNHVQEKYGEEINKFVQDMINKMYDVKPGTYIKEFLLITCPPPSMFSEKLYKKIVSALAYEYLGSKRFGGNERQLFTRVIDVCKGDVALVSRIIRVQTGKHFPSSGGYDHYSGEYDYEPGGLYDMKSHKLLTLTFCAHYPHSIRERYVENNCFDGPCIEAINVKKIHKITIAHTHRL